MFWVCFNFYVYPTIMCAQKSAPIPKETSSPAFSFSTSSTVISLVSLFHWLFRRTWKAKYLGSTREPDSIHCSDQRDETVVHCVDIGGVGEALRGGGDPAQIRVCRRGESCVPNYYPSLQSTVVWSCVQCSSRKSFSFSPRHRHSISFTFPLFLNQIQKTCRSNTRRTQDGNTWKEVVSKCSRYAFFFLFITLIDFEHLLFLTLYSCW